MTGAERRYGYYYFCKTSVAINYPDASRGAPIKALNVPRGGASIFFIKIRASVITLKYNPII